MAVERGFPEPVPAFTIRLGMPQDQPRVEISVELLDH